MNKKLLFTNSFSLKGLGVLTLCAFMTVSCHNNKLNSGIDLTNLDTTAVAGKDFYQFACGGWMKKNPLTGEYSRFGSFDQLRENNLKQLNDLITGIAAKGGDQGTIEQKISDLYNVAMDSAKLNTDGYGPIKADLKRIAAIKTKADLLLLLPDLYTSGLDTYFSIYVDADAKDSKKNLVQTYQSGISLGEREYYLDNDAHTKDIREKYKQHIINMFKLTGFDDANAAKAMEAVMKIETRLATAAYDNVKLRDPQTNYNKMSVADVQKLIPAINWNTYLSALGLKNIKEISISQKESMIEVSKIIDTESVENHIAYLQWKLIDSASPYLADNIYAEHFNFYGKVLSGKQEQRPRWKRAVDMVDGALGEAVGQMYVKEYFPPAAKERMLKLVANLQEALGQRINALPWMGDSTKAKAHEKLATFYVKIGYPDKWRDYSKLDIMKDSYYANIKRSNQFDHAYMFAKADKPVDKDEWYMTPQTVNAYYNPTTNEICFPAGILQPPFFDMNADDAFNYGAIGVVIGHEMTHGFDDQGCQFDKEGNLKNWWTDKDKEQFDARAKVLANFFDSIVVAPGVHANGKFTLGENIADHGGLQVSFQAFKNATKSAHLHDVDGFTPEQRFFLSYANVWAGNIRPEEILVLTKSDPHSLGRWRVNGALPHIQAWYDAFGIKETDPMYVKPENRVSIW
ncbi:MAG: endothelin-converting enzyme [Bacteroidetes bacterium]|nr:endothelin-converting enzyme [Bacteroidota bacterium]